MASVPSRPVALYCTRPPVADAVDDYDNGCYGFGANQTYCLLFGPGLSVEGHDVYRVVYLDGSRVRFSGPSHQDRMLGSCNI